MAERSFAAEVQQLKVPAGTEFRGEGILAVTKALLECGVGYVTGYQGSPISHLMDVLADAQPILEDLGVYFEPAASEAGAAAALSASVNYPVRGAVTWKSTVGTNVASDALANLASGGVIGGALIIVGEDYGEGSSIMQERTHAFAMKSQMWLLDPKPHLPSIVQAVHDGFALSEATNTPVMLQLRIRSCHLHGRFIARENQRPKFSLKEALENPQRDVNRIVLPPASFLHEKEKIQDRWPAATRFIREHKLNEMRSGESAQIGIITLGGLSHNVLRALHLQGQADLFGDSRVPLYILNVAYPLVEEEVLGFCLGKEGVLVVEEGQPDYLEQNINTILRRHGVACAVHGKDLLPMGGDYTVTVLQKGIQGFLDKFLGKTDLEHVDHAQAATKSVVKVAAKMFPIMPALPPRPPGLCVGCPERPIFSALKLAEQTLGQHHISADIGCHLFSIMPPFNLGATTMGYGLGACSASAFNAGGMLGANKRAIAIMGDGGFWHNGLTSGIANAVFNKHDNVFVIVDNNYTSATGGQDIPSSRVENEHRSTAHAIEAAVRGVGVEWVRTLPNTYDVNTMRVTLSEALTTSATGPKVIVAQSECMLNRQRREKPQKAAAIKIGKRMVQERFGVDAAICSGDHACMRVSGCPSLTLAPSGDALKPDPVAFVDNQCVACGHCGEVADAAILCPSFYKISKIHNPSRWERWVGGMRRSVLGWLQAREKAKRAKRELY